MPEGPAIARLTGFPAPAGLLDLELHAGDIVHLTGPNGCGKTSLLRALAGLPAPLRPRGVQVAGRDPANCPARSLATTVRWAPSDPRDGLVGLTVAGEFRLRRQVVPAALAGLGDRDTARLSCGEAHRVALELADTPVRLLLLDEPAWALDAAGRSRLAALVAQQARRGAVVLADHSGWAAGVATRTLELAPAPLAQPVIQLPVVVGPPLLTAPASAVPRGPVTVRLPAVHLGPGFHAVTGPNGAGKTTLLERLAGLHHGADVAIQGAPAVPGRNVRLLQTEAGRRLCAERVGDELVGMADVAGLASGIPRDRHPLSLSAGEAQRVALARVLGRPAAVYLLDEPEAHLDRPGRDRLLRAVADRAAAGACIVAATHDAGLQQLAQTRIEVRP